MLFPTSGGIAQLGERLNGIQEVSGSIPLISTKCALRHKKNLEIIWFQGFFFFKSGKIAVFAICACALDFWWKFWKSRGQVLWRKLSWIAPPPWRKPLPTSSLPAKQRGLRTRLCKAMNSSSDPLMKWSNRMSFWIFAIFAPPFFIISNWKVWFS